MKRLCAIALAGFAAVAAALEYPDSGRGDVVENYHGTRVSDPYRWLEDVDGPATRNWIERQNDLSRPFLRKLPERKGLQARLTELWDYERYGVPERVAGQLFYTRQDGLQNQPVLFVRQEGTDAKPRALIDPNRLASDGTVAVSQWEVSPDGAYVAYALARGGSDWNEIRVLDVAKARDTGDVLTRIKFSNIAWTRDSKGFFYSRYPDPPRDTEGVFEALAHQKLYYHRLGTPQAEDLLILERPDEPQWSFDAEVSDDGLFAFIRIARGSGTENALYYLYLGDPEAPKLDGKVASLVTGFHASYEPVGNEGSVLYLLTDSRAPNKRIVAVDLRAPALEHWVTLVPEGRDAIVKAKLAGGQFVLVKMRDAADRLVRHELNGRPLPELELPGPGALARLSGDPLMTGSPPDNDVFVSYTSFARPETNFRCDLVRGRCEEFQPLRLRFEPDDYVTEQVFYKSKDGTRVPMFISHRKGWSREDGPRPLLLYGYGGFDIPLTPAFKVPFLAWMEQGGILAQANLRGGGEYGKRWHEAGTKARKQNVFDDFIAAAEYLVARGYTTSPQLAIHGRSNGGLLVGAVLNQRPDLFAAALPAVGVMDMLRYHRFTIGWAWASDYGSSDDPRAFRYLYKYSPYHNVAPGTKYPAVLITTADRDDRVVPGHSFKYAAALQAAQAGDKPVLIRIDTQAGHGRGKPVTKEIEEWADQLAFITHFTKPASPAP